MLTRRIIPCLDVKDNRVVKGVNFLNLRDAGDPVELGARYSDEGADELVFLDITATIRSRQTIVELVRKVAENVFIPFTVGGGIQTVGQMDELLRSGACESEPARRGGTTLRQPVRGPCDRRPAFEGPAGPMAGLHQGRL
jgi:imidazoleglycerol phosphate synthase cyclase subunit